MPMPSLRGFHAVGTAENGFWFRGIIFRPQAYLAGISHHLRHIASADHVEMYNPTMDNWRRLPQTLGTNPFPDPFQRWFVANNRLHSITRSEICLHDLETNSKTCLHSILTENDLMAPEVSIFGPLFCISCCR